MSHPKKFFFLFCLSLVLTNAPVFAEEQKAPKSGEPPKAPVASMVPEVSATATKDVAATGSNEISAKTSSEKKTTFTVDVATNEKKEMVRTMGGKSVKFLFEEGLMEISVDGKPSNLNSMPHGKPSNDFSGWEKDQTETFSENGLTNEVFPFTCSLTLLEGSEPDSNDVRKVKLKIDFELK